MNEKIQLLFDALKDEYDLGTIEDFTSYLQDDKKRSLFYEKVIAPNYDVSSIEEFENVYGLGGFGLKKKDGTSQEVDTAALPQETISSAFVESNQVSPVVGAGFDESITTDQGPFRVEEVMSPEDVEYFAEQDRLNKKNKARVKGDPIKTKQNLYRELTKQINANPRHNTDEFREEAFDLWNQMSEFKTSYREGEDVDKWELGPTLADSYQGFEDFLEDMKNPVTEVQAYNLRMAGRDTSRRGTFDIRNALNMTYKLDYARENLEYNKREKEEKRQQLQKEEKKKEIGEAENLRSWLKLDQDALEDYLDTTPMPREFEGEINRDEWKDRMRQKWSQHQKDIKSQAESLDKEDARFMDSYLSSITPGLIGREEEEVVPMLNKEYGKYGFTFEEAGVGDAMIVTSSKDGAETLQIDLDPFTSGEEVLESYKLKKYLKENAVHSEPIVEDEDRMFTEKAYRAQSLRDKAMIGEDGRPSTVIFEDAGYDGRNVVYPTLFPKDPNKYTQDPGDWMQLSGDAAYEEALKRGEVFYFDTPSEASNFAKGSWKYTDISDVEAEKFYNDRGLDYQSMHVAYERYQDLLDKEETMVNLLTRGGDIIEVDPTEGFKTKYRGILTYEKDGGKEYARVRPDIQEHYNSVVSDREALFDDSFANDYAVKIREKWDQYAYEKQQEKAQSAANLNMMAKYINQETDKEALDIFNTTLDKVDVESLTPEEMSIYNELNAIKEETAITKKMAAQEYENANTYLDSRFNKEQVQTFLEGWEGIWAQIRSGWDRGEAAEEILALSLGVSDITDPKELSRIAATIVEEQRQAEKRGVQRTATLTASARNASEFWETVWDNPLDYMLGLAGNSMSQMAPYGWKIVGAAAGTGAATGAAYGALGANPYTVAGGATVGAKWGMATGMAATSYAMEYTNAVLDAGKNHGYDMMNPKDVELALQDQNVWSEGREIGMKRGIPIGLVDFLGGGLAGKIFKVGSVASKGAVIGAQVAERAIIDPALEGLGEYLAQSVAGQEIDWKEIVAEMAGGMGSNSSTMAIEMLNQFRSKSNVELANNLTGTEFMAKEKSSDKSLSNWANRMHKLGKIDSDMNQRIQENIGARREARSLLDTEGVGRVLGAKKTKEETRVMQLLQARDELSSTTNRKEVFKAKIKAINEELAIMAETKAMAPEDSMVELALEEGKKDQPARYSIDGKLYTKKAFLEKVEAMSEGKRANKKIQVLNDPETAKQVGLKTIELDAVQKQQTEEGVLRPEKEEPTEQVGLQEVGQVQPEEVQPEVETFEVESINDLPERYKGQEPVTEGEVTIGKGKDKVTYKRYTFKKIEEAPEVQEDVVVVDKGTKEDVKAFREGTIEDSRLESLLAGVAARKNEGKKLTKFQQEMFDANQERVEKLQVESKLLGEIFDVDTSVAVAPYFDTQVETIEDAKDLRQSESYQAYRAKIDEVAKDFGLEVEVQENIGGYKNESGNEIVEVSNTVVLKGATIEQAEEFAAIMAALTPDVQEASIAAQVVDEGSANHNANMYSVVVSDTQAAVNALKKAGITDYSINQSTNEVTFIDVLEFSDLQLQEKIGNFIKELKKENVSYEQKGYEAVDSRYVGKGDRQAILRRAKGSRPKKGKQGQRVHSALDQAISRDAYFQDLSVENYLTDGKKAGNRIFNVGIPAVKKIADRYYQRVFRKPRRVFEGTKEIQEDRAKEIAKAFEESKRTIDDPEVKAAYDKLVEETIEQYKELIDAGYVVEVNNTEPYDNSQQMIDDLRDNKRIKIFSTESGLGDTEITEQQRKDNPLLQETEFVDVNGVPLLANDLFRAIHDFFGHAELGNGFGPIGEENAWNVHVRMFSPLAAKAMTAETRGQNSWVNFSGINDEVFKKRDKARELRKRGKVEEAKKLVNEIYDEISFAEQKVTLLPDEYSVPTDLKEEKLQPQLETEEKEDVEGVAAEKERAMSEMEEAGVELAEDPFTVEQVAPEAEVTTITLDKDNPLTKDLERIGLKDLEGKKVNLVMADRLKVDEKNMGGPFFPLIKALRGKIAWASIDNEAASFIVKGAIDADYTVVYNMSSSGVDSNKVMGLQLIEKLDAISPQKKQEVFQLIKDHIKKLNNKNINKIKGLVAKSTSLDQLVDSIYNPKNHVDVRAAFTRAVLPSQDVLEGSKSTPIANEMRELGVTIEGLRDEVSEEFTKNIPTGSMTMVLEVTDKKGNKVTEKTKEEAIVGRDQQKKEGFPEHENYPVYIRGRVVGLLKETTPFWNVMPDYLKTINKKVAGLIKTIKKTKPIETLTPQELKVVEKLQATFKATGAKNKLEALSKVRLSKELDQDVREKLRSQIVAAKKLKNANKIDAAIKQVITPFVEKGKISAKKARAEAIRSAEMSASVVRDVSSPKASTYQKFVSVLRRSFPSVEVVSTQKEFDELAKDIYAKKLTTKNQKVYGAVYKGKLYLNPGLANYNTPIHEFGHVWLNVAKEANKALYNKGLSLIKESPYVKRVESSKSYKKIIDQMRKDGVSESDIEAYVLEEALAMAIGDRGEAFVVAAQKKSFKSWLETLYGYVRKLTGISKYTSEQIETISLDEFLDAVNVDLLSGRKLFEGYQVSEMGDQLQLSMAKKPESTSMSAIIEEARTLNFSDASIELYLRQKGYKVADIRSAMEIPLDMFTTMPPAFANVSNNSAVGQQLFSRVMEKANKFAKKKKDISQLRDKAKEILMADPEFKELTKELQAELVIGLDKSLAQTNNRAIASDVKNMKAMLRERKAGAKGVANLRKEMKKFVLQNLPKTQWSTTRVKKILREISDAKYYKDYYKLTTKPDNDIRLVLDRVVSEINKQNVEDILSGVEKQLSTKTTKLVGARVKGKLLPEAQKRIEKIKSDMLAQDSSVESVTEKIDKLREEREQLMNANETTDEQVKRIFDIDMAILYNESILLENTDSYKADTLKDVYNRLKSTFKEERNEYVEAIKAAKDRYNTEKSQIFEEVSGVKIDYSSEESVEEATRKIEQKENKNRNRSKAVKVLKSFLESFDWVILRTEAIEGLIDRIQKMPGEIFGGKAVELISDRFDKSRNMYIEGMNFLKATTENKAKEIFGKNYIRKMKRNNIKSVKIYTDPKRVNELTQQLKDKSLTKKERRKISNEINSLTMLMSQNEMYYIYNQAKDPSLMPGLENKPGWGKSTEDILAEIDSKLDPEVRRWADWQVEEFFPSVYERYNAVYKEIYRTNMPWNEFYAGIVSREGVEQTMGLLDMGANNYQTMVGARSTKARINNSNPILTMDGDSMLASYISEMEYFRAYGETVRDVTKIIKDPKIKRAIEVTSGKDVYNILNKQYDKIIDRGKSRAGSGSKIFNWMTRSFVVTKLGLNPTIALKQFTSALAFADYIGYRNWTKEAAKGMANNLKTFKSSWTELYENSVYLQDRYNKGDFARLLEDYNTSKKEKLYSGVTTIKGQEISVDKAMDLMMFLVKFGDKAGVMGSIPNYNYYKSQFKKNNPKATEQQAIDHAVKKVEKQIDTTQQSSAGIQARDYFQTDNFFYRWMSLFTSSSRALLRKDIIAIRNLYRKLVSWDKSAGRGTLRQNIRTFVTYHVVLPMFFQYVALGLPGILRDWREEDDDELGMAAALGTFNSLFILGDILAGARDLYLDKPWAASFRNLPVFDQFGELYENIQRMDKAKKDETKEKYFNKAILNVLEMGGVPANQVLKIKNNWSKLLNEDMDFGEAVARVLNYSDYTIEGGSKKKGKTEKKKKTEKKVVYR